MKGDGDGKTYGKRHRHEELFKKDIGARAHKERNTYYPFSFAASPD